VSDRRDVVFVGRRADCWPALLESPGETIDPRHMEFAPGDDPAALAAAIGDADVVIALDPAQLPSGTLAPVTAQTVAILPTGSQADAVDRIADADFDRIVALDPGLAAASDRVWRSLAPPVNDALFADVAPAAGKRFAFFGRWSPRRERFLIDSKHGYDLMHVDGGAVGERLLELYATVSVAVNLHASDRPAFEHRVPMHLAAGHLLISEKLAPTRGLETGLDFLEITNHRELTKMLGALNDVPELHHRVRLRGRRKAEQFRASAVYERLLGDLDRDLRAFGSARSARQ
jgi:hypothetical protein